VILGGGFKIRWGQPRGGSSPLAGILLNPLNSADYIAERGKINLSASVSRSG